MPSTRDLRRRIKSVKNTSQITRAMQMVAASKMRKAQQAALSGRPYAEMMNDVLSQVTSKLGEFSHPLMEARPVKKKAVILVTSDKGLCGGLNSNLLREISKIDPNRDTLFITAGRKGSQFIARTRRELSAEFQYSDVPAFSEARALSKFAISLYEEGKVDQVDIAFTNFVNTLVQKPTVFPFLPVGEFRSFTGDVKGEEIGSALHADSLVEYKFEPSPATVMGSLIPHYLNFLAYQSLLEAKASEHSARMVAMKSATDNAKQLIKDLTLEFNKVRQASITQEILEIATAALAV
jgi:F-type H+-transporting ATPase subunit gamma